MIGRVPAGRETRLRASPPGGGLQAPGPSGPQVQSAQPFAAHDEQVETSLFRSASRARWTRTAALFGVIPALSAYYYACLTGDNTYLLLASEKDLDDLTAKAAAARNCLGDSQRFRSEVARAVDFDREALVLIEQFYGGTGMARAELSVTGPEDGVLRASIVVTVPPPPVTPDVARFRFAFAVDKTLVRRVDIVGGGGAVESLSIP